MYTVAEVPPGEAAGSFGRVGNREGRMRRADNRKKGAELGSSTMEGRTCVLK